MEHGGVGFGMVVGVGVGVGLAYSTVVGGEVGGCTFGRVVICLLILGEFKWDGGSIALGNARRNGELVKGRRC